MEFGREHRSNRKIVTVVVAVGLVLGAARAGSAQPVGTLTQLPRPDACTQLGGDGINCRDGLGLDGAMDVAISPDGKSVYVLGFLDNAIATFSRDPASGALTQLAAPNGCIADAGDGVACQDGLGLLGPSGVTVSPDNAHVYVASLGGLTTFVRDPSTGVLTQLPGADGCIDDNNGFFGCTDAYGDLSPTELLVSPDGKFVYTTSENAGTISVFARNKTTGKLTQLPAPEGCLSTTGDGVTCKSALAIAGPRDLSISKNGKHLYVAASDSNAVAIFKRNQTTGALTQPDAPNGCVAQDGDGVTCTDAVALNGARDLAESNNGRHIYVASTLSQGVAAFRRDKTSGELEQLYFPNACTTATGDNVLCRPGLALSNTRAIAVTKNGKHAYVASFAADGVAVFARKRN